MSSQLPSDEACCNFVQNQLDVKIIYVDKHKEATIRVAANQCIYNFPVKQAIKRALGTTVDDKTFFIGEEKMSKWNTFVSYSPRYENITIKMYKKMRDEDY